MKVLFSYIFVFSTIFCFSQDRFTHYQAISKSLEIEVLYVTWADINLPNYIKASDYEKFVDKKELIEYCFYIDAKDSEKLKFKIPYTTDKLIKKIPIKLKGKFYKTKQFDDSFPNPLFEDYRKTGDLKFKTANDEFLVFVLD